MTFQPCYPSTAFTAGTSVPPQLWHVSTQESKSQKRLGSIGQAWPTCQFLVLGCTGVAGVPSPSPYRQGAGGWPLAPRTTAPARYPPRGLGRLTKHVTRVSCATGIHPHNHCEGDRPARGLWVRYPPPTITEKGVVTSSSGHSAAGPRFTMEQKQAAQVEL